MEHIVNKLDKEILTNWGFKFDGFYWIHENFIFKLSNSSKDHEYNVELIDKNAGTNPPPIKTNSQLMQLIVGTSQLYIAKESQKIHALNPAGQLKELHDIVNRYFDFDPRLLFNIINMGGGLSLVPGNEFTHTLLSGLECEFKVKIADEDRNVTEDIIYYSPEVISYAFLKSLYLDHSIEGVEVRAKSESTGEIIWSPFYGCGLPKTMTKDESDISE